MKNVFWRIFGVLGISAGVATCATAQTAYWDLQCIDPGTQNPYSTPFIFEAVFNDLFAAAGGATGFVVYGDAGNPDDDYPCYVTTHNMDLPGRLGFAYGPRGSIQDQYPADPGNSGFVDDNMALTFTWPYPGGNSTYAATIVDGTRTLFGANGISLAYTGDSNRYFVLESTNDGILVHLQVVVTGDAAVCSWTFTNGTGDPHNIGLWYASKLGMLTEDESVTDRNGANAAGLATLESPTFFFRGFKDLYPYIPGQRPPRIDHAWDRNLDPANFPQQFYIHFGQTAALGGIAIENGPSPATTDPVTGQSDTTQVTTFQMGDAFFMLGRDWDNPAFPDRLWPDNSHLESLAYMQKYAPVQVAANGGTYTITQFVHSTWGASNYVKPYSIVVDAPKLVAVDFSGDPEAQDGLRPNPMVIRVYIDNTWYAEVNKEVAVNDVRIKLNLPAGLTLSVGQTAIRTIPQVNPREVRFVDFMVESDGNISGALPISVEVNDVVTQTPRTVRSSIQVASTPKLNLLTGANLVTVPWDFADTSIGAVLAPLTTPADYTAYKWDPQQGGYVVATNFERGRSYWIVANSDFPYMPLSSNPSVPGDINSGFLQINTKFGWNNVGNPFPYPISLGQLVGVSAANPQKAYTWTELVQQGIVNGALASFDPTTGDYSYIEGADSVLLPNQGYWIYVGTLQDVTISYPAVFHPALPGSGRGVNDKWLQSDQHWRLKLAARTAQALDAQNYIGRGKDANDVKANMIMEPPTIPSERHDVQLAIEENIDGKPTRLAQALSTNAGRKTWKVVVTTKGAATVNLTWPNLSTVPKNMQFRLIDTATNETRNLRQASGYTFTTSDAATRVFTIEQSTGQVGRAVIGNVVVGGGGRGPGVPFTINYTLSSDATTTVRILSGAGKEIYTASRGRADRSGENTVTWAMRDNANRLVAPGSYQAEIIAETATGERARRVVPINVVR